MKQIEYSNKTNELATELAEYVKLQYPNLDVQVKNKDVIISSGDFKELQKVMLDILERRDNIERLHLKNEQLKVRISEIISVIIVFIIFLITF